MNKARKREVDRERAKLIWEKFEDLPLVRITFLNGTMIEGVKLAPENSWNEHVEAEMCIPDTVSIRKLDGAVESFELLSILDVRDLGAAKTREYVLAGIATRADKKT